jgi:murein DD-endopeptidase MepM/ murein hydrolase activator NlpD
VRRVGVRCWCLGASLAGVMLGGACRGASKDSFVETVAVDSAAGLAHVNGATLDSATQVTRPLPPPVAASAASPNAALPGSSATAPGAGNGAAERTPAITIPNPTPSGPSPTGVAPTPDELSALAASLVVPVVGVTPSELRGSFHAVRGGGSRQHNAIDIPAPRGTPVISATTGRVLKLFNSKAGGLMVYAADATERFILMYGHLDRYADGITEGMRLEQGRTIGYVGTTGNAPPNVPHLHFAIARTTNIKRWWNGTPVDPEPLLKRK